ncbi:hypothetical protein DNTS_031597 [Danionella cerebrum]|uniref:J domain-containing protein n=1 Tax=Danionella cerebrum TaxID=2873325 RepID=A0A553QJJ2_9TELE|nr:hypothetical protein DNTS_031597 [Danionella translucida]
MGIMKAMPQPFVCKREKILINVVHFVRASCSWTSIFGSVGDVSGTVKVLSDSFQPVWHTGDEGASQLHPDMDPSNVRLHDQFVELNEAYRVLSKESSRRDYDITLRSKTGPDIRSSSTSTGAYSSPSSDEAAEARRYWGQFRQPPPQKDTPEERRKKKKLNICLVCGCVLIMILSAVAHTIVYRKLEVIHNNFMDEKDRTITKLYNEAKERARINGLQKQHEIFRQRHNALMERFKNPKDEDEKRS